jgi:hypothetical protein
MANPAAHPPLLAYWESQYLTQRVFDAGPLWFVEALLLMDIALAILVRWLPTVRVVPTFPTGWAIGAFIAGLGVASFLVRLPKRCRRQRQCNCRGDRRVVCPRPPVHLLAFRHGHTLWYSHNR